MICSVCGEENGTKTVDNGIGAFEFWGARGVHQSLEEVSECCEAEMVEGGSRQVHNDTHIARKPWGRVLKSGLRYIMPGDKYVKYVTKHWRHNGPSWFTERRLRLEPCARQ